MLGRADSAEVGRDVQEGECLRVNQYDLIGADGNNFIWEDNGFLGRK